MGEVPGRNGASCILGSLNLKKFLVKGETGYTLDFASISLVTSIAVKFLDSVSSLTRSGIKLFDETNETERKIGLGVMGWADVLAYMGLAYDSPEAMQYAEELSKVIYLSARKMSQILAKQHGTFPGYSEKSIDPITLEPMYPQRNANLLAIAPTGTLSLISEVNASIEPFFMLAYKKNFRFGSDTTEKSSIITSATFKEIITEKFGEDTAWKILEDTATTGKLSTNPEFSDEINAQILQLQPVFKTAYEVSPENHVRMQTAWQKYVDLSISKTVNMPSEASVEDVLKIIYLAWKQGSKGLTIYRDNSRSEQVMEKPKN